MFQTVPFADFPSAATVVLAFLHERIGFNLWIVTRTEQNDWIVLQAEDHGYGVSPGKVFAWADTFCSRMVDGSGPCVAPVSADIPLYAEAAIGREVSIGAYIGVPLQGLDGKFFGTLCAIHPAPMPATIADELPLVQLMARLLSTLLAADLYKIEMARRNERIQADAQRDILTGLYNRRGWEMLLTAEEERCQNYGHPACTIAIHVVGLQKINADEGLATGDDLLRRTGQALRAATLTTHIAARVGDDTFAVLGVECGHEAAIHLRERVEGALQEWRVPAQARVAMRNPAGGLADAWSRATNAP